MSSGPHQPPSSRWRHIRLFSPILAGATLRERAIACLGALAGIGLTGMICGLMFGQGSNLPLIVAPMGASAVLLFAVPSSPLAQPWSIIGGNSISALVGVIVSHFVHTPVLAIGIGVSLAIGAMSLARCLHPPGGAAALTAVLGGPAVASWGLLFPLVPVALNSCVLVLLGLVLHKMAGRAYPHVALPAPINVHGTLDPPPQLRTGFRREDIDAALAALGETFDIDQDDVARLLEQVERQAAIRVHGPLTCADIMSRDVVTARETVTAEAARGLLLQHNIRTLPIVDDERRLLGTVGLRELAAASDGLNGVLSQAATAQADAPALGLLTVLTDGRTHAVLIVDDERRVLGLVSQTDLLVSIARRSSMSGALHGATGEDQDAYRT